MRSLHATALLLGLRRKANGTAQSPKRYAPFSEMKKNINDKLDEVLKNFGMDTKEWPDFIAPFRHKLEILEKANNYKKLLKALFASKDLDEFNSYIFEAQFAYDFLANGQQLSYESRQLQDNLSSIDFCYELDNRKKIYFELRLIQAREWIKHSIKSQLKHSNYFQIELNGNHERDENIRLQNLILSKCQDKNGNPLKFAMNKDVINAIVVNISELHLTMIDKFDCLLTIYGDNAVPFFCRRGLFGLWQLLSQNSIEQEKELYRKFEHVRESIHAILFVRHVKHSGYLDRLFIDRELEYFLIGNNNLLQKRDYKQITEKLCFLRTWPQWDRMVSGLET